MPKVFADEELSALLQEGREEAKRTPPNHCAWAELIAGLRCARRGEVLGHHDRGLSVRQTAVAETLQALKFFLMKHQFVVEEDLTTPFLYLQEAIRDVAEGRNAPFFKPTIRKGKNTRKNTRAETIQVFAAAALDELMATKGEREAARQVVSAVRKGRLVGFKRYTPEKVERFRDRLEQGQPTFSERAIKMYKDRSHFHPEATAQERGEWFLAQLRKGIGLLED